MTAMKVPSEISFGPFVMRPATYPNEYDCKTTLEKTWNPDFQIFNRIGSEALFVVKWPDAGTETISNTIDLSD